MIAKNSEHLWVHSCMVLGLFMCLGAPGCPAQLPYEHIPADGSITEQGAEKSPGPDISEPVTGDTVGEKVQADTPGPDITPLDGQESGMEPAVDAPDAGPPEPSLERSSESAPPEPVGDADCRPVPRQQALDVAYDQITGVDANLLSLDLAVPARQDGCALAPVVVWVHGGGWSIGDKRNGFIQKAALFFQAGYALVSVNYRLTPEGNTDPKLRHPVHIQDVAKAFAWIKANIQKYGGDPGRIAALGHSTGAYLVALLSTDDAYLKAHQQTLSMIRCTGSFDTEGYDIPATMKTAGPSLTKTYTNAFGTDTTVWTKASPITHVAKGKGIPPFLFAQRGTADRRAGLASFAKALNDAGVASQVIDASSLDHAGVNDAIGKQGDTIMTPPLMDFLKKCFAKP